MKKKIFAALLAVTMLGSTGVAGAVYEEDAVVVSQFEYSESEVTPRADVIVYKFRVYNGKSQYRRWNETKGYWVDPYWIDLE